MHTNAHNCTLLVPPEVAARNESAPTFWLCLLVHLGGWRRANRTWTLEGARLHLFEAALCMQEIKGPVCLPCSSTKLASSLRPNNPNWAPKHYNWRLAWRLEHAGTQWIQSSVGGASFWGPERLEEGARKGENGGRECVCWLQRLRGGNKIKAQSVRAETV